MRRSFPVPTEDDAAARGMRCSAREPREPPLPVRGVCSAEQKAAHRPQHGDGWSAPQPPCASDLVERRDDKDTPRNECQQCHGQEVPERLLVVIEIAAKACQIVLEDKNAEELRLTQLNGYIPRQGDQKKKQQ